MKARERVMIDLNHREPDSVPVSLGGTARKVSNPLFHEMRRNLGITGESASVTTGISHRCYGDRLLDATGTDTCFLYLSTTEPYKRRVHTDGSYDSEWGITFRDEGYFTAVVGQPLREATMTDLERYPWPAVRGHRRVEGLDERSQALYQNTNHALLASRPVPCRLVQMACVLRGGASFLVEMLENQPTADVYSTDLSRWNSICSDYNWTSLVHVCGS